MRRLNNAEEQHAQHIACSHLIRGCESAISELQAASCETSGLPRTKKRAEDILTEVLSSWRHAIDTLASEQAPLWSEATMDRWTSGEFVEEALHRKAGNRPALRLMQTLTLQAQINRA